MAQAKSQTFQLIKISLSVKLIYDASNTLRHIHWIDADETMNIKCACLVKMDSVQRITM